MQEMSKIDRHANFHFFSREASMAYHNSDHIVHNNTSWQMQNHIYY